MFPEIVGRYTLSMLGIIATTVPLIYFIRKYMNAINDVEKVKPVIEVLFFSEEGIGCKDHFIKENEKKSCSLKNCSFHNLSRMLQYLNSAETSLDICMYLFTVRDLGAAVIRAHQRGVRVRVITEEDMANCSGSQISLFQEKGLPVRYRQKSTRLMHHKFVVIDKSILMTGSLNWSMQAICGNWDNLIITTQNKMVRQYITEFERIWKTFE